jgi:cell division protein FtsQ
MRRVKSADDATPETAPPPKPAAKESAPRRAPPRRRLSPLRWKRLRRIGIAALVVTAVALPLGLFHSRAGNQMLDTLRTRTLALSARAGFRLQEIYVEGRSRTPRDELLAALGVKRGDPILGIDLAAAQRRLEAISWVKTATVERWLPGELRLLISERAPIALWQNQGRYYLVDGEGQVVGDEIEAYANLPLMVGEGAPDHASALIDLLSAEPDLESRVKAAQWVGDRRWTITFDRTEGGVDVRLPEEDPLSAWHELARLDREQSLLERKIALIDMRLPDRLVLRATAGAEETGDGRKGAAGGRAGDAAKTKQKPPSGKNA